MDMRQRERKPDMQPFMAQGEKEPDVGIHGRRVAVQAPAQWLRSKPRCRLLQSDSVTVEGSS